jgi:hypothetical protein
LNLSLGQARLYLQTTQQRIDEPVSLPDYMLLLITYVDAYKMLTLLRDESYMLKKYAALMTAYSLDALLAAIASRC